MRLSALLCTTILILPAISFAFFCPSNFNQINIGDSIDQVKQQCGNPDSENTVEKKEEGPQEWSYFVPQTVATDTTSAVSGTLKTQIAFDASGKVINISVNGIGVGSTTICGNTLQLGDTRDSVKATCGDPTFINKQTLSTNNTTTDVTKVTTFIYKSNPGGKLTFENGKLTSRN